MSTLACLIIEDEPLAVNILADYIAQVPFLTLAGTCRDAIEATNYLRTHPVDVLFLDIHLPKLKGIAFLKTLQNTPAVILTTAYHQYAVDGFDLNVTDYLLKPISFERFLVAVNKVPQPTLPLSPDMTVSKEYLFLNVQKRRVKVLFADIAYVESQREYVKVVTATATYLTKLSTHEIESLLPPDRFKRVHRSFIVSVEQIDAYTAEAIDIAGTSIPVGRGYRAVLEAL